MVDAVSNTSLAALIDRAMSGREVTLQARPTPSAPQPSGQPTPTIATSSTTDTPYKRGSVESENVQMATGMAKAARTNIETLNIGASTYNGATRMLADTDRIEDLRRRGGDKAVDLFVKMHQQIQPGGLLMMNGASEKMAQEFSVTGTADEGGRRLL